MYYVTHNRIPRTKCINVIKKKNWLNEHTTRFDSRYEVHYASIYIYIKENGDALQLIKLN